MIILGAIRSPGAIALIGAAAGVMGAVLGAVAGGVATYKIEAQRQKFDRRRDLRAELRDRERELAAVRGIARVWQTKFDDFTHLIEFWCAEEPAAWWDDSQDIDTLMSVDDMKAVAAALSESDWRDIDIALSAVRAVQNARRYHWGLDEAERPKTLDAEDRQYAADATEALGVAKEVLGRLGARSPQIPEYDLAAPRSSR